MATRPHPHPRPGVTGLSAASTSCATCTAASPLLAVVLLLISLGAVGRSAEPSLVTVVQRIDLSDAKNLVYLPMHHCPANLTTGGPTTAFVSIMAGTFQQIPFPALTPPLAMKAPYVPAFNVTFLYASMRSAVVEYGLDLGDSTSKLSREVAPSGSEVCFIEVQEVIADTFYLTKLNQVGFQQGFLSVAPKKLIPRPGFPHQYRADVGNITLELAYGDYWLDVTQQTLLTRQRGCQQNRVILHATNWAASMTYRCYFQRHNATEVFAEVQQLDGETFCALPTALRSDSELAYSIKAEHVQSIRSDFDLVVSDTYTHELQNLPEIEVSPRNLTGHDGGRDYTIFLTIRTDDCVAALPEFTYLAQLQGSPVHQVLTLHSGQFREAAEDTSDSNLCWFSATVRGDADEHSSVLIYATLDAPECQVQVGLLYVNERPSLPTPIPSPSGHRSGTVVPSPTALAQALEWLQAHVMVSVLGGLTVLLVLVGAVVSCAVKCRKSRSGPAFQGADYDLLEVSKMQSKIVASDLKLVEQIGRGAFAVVYRGTWRRTTVAIKRIVNVSSENLQSLLLESSLMQSLRHPNVIAYLGTAHHNDSLYVVTEYAPRGSLKKVLRDPGIVLSLYHQYQFIVQVVQGMEYLHSTGLIHRDLKSDNILVDSEWKLKVADFGLSKFVDDAKQMHTMTAVGTPYWAAPEVLRNQRYSLKADVYSFGIVMYEILSRQKPYADIPEGERVEVMYNIAFKRVRPTFTLAARKELPAYFLTLYAVAVADSPDHRPTFSEIAATLSLNCVKPADGDGALPSTQSNDDLLSSDYSLHSATTSASSPLSLLATTANSASEHSGSPPDHFAQSEDFVF